MSETRTMAFTGPAVWPVRHRVFVPGEVVTFDLDDPADAALYEKCRVLPWFTEGAQDVAPKRRGRPRRVKDEA